MFYIYIIAGVLSVICLFFSLVVGLFIFFISKDKKVIRHRARRVLTTLLIGFILLAVYLYGRYGDTKYRLQLDNLLSVIAHNIVQDTLLDCTMIQPIRVDNCGSSYGGSNWECVSVLEAESMMVRNQDGTPYVDSGLQGNCVGGNLWPSEEVRCERAGLTCQKSSTCRDDSDCNNHITSSPIKYVCIEGNCKWQEK